MATTTLSDRTVGWKDLHISKAHHKGHQIPPRTKLPRPHPSSRRKSSKIPEAHKLETPRRRGKTSRANSPPTPSTDSNSASSARLGEVYTRWFREIGVTAESYLTQRQAARFDGGGGDATSSHLKYAAGADAGICVNG
jgi:hypothetical protein